MLPIYLRFFLVFPTYIHMYAKEDIIDSIEFHFIGEQLHMIYFEHKHVCCI
jgi:hypothetical protein